MHNIISELAGCLKYTYLCSLEVTLDFLQISKGLEFLYLLLISLQL